MKSIRKQNCILAIVMFALMSILTSFPVQAQTINQKQAKVTVQYASIPAKVETSSYHNLLCNHRLYFLL